MSDAIYRRPAVLVLAILEVLDQADDLVEWRRIVDRFSSEARPWKTVENILYELDAFGAVHKVGGGHAPGHKVKALKITPLGSAWSIVA